MWMSLDSPDIDLGIIEEMKRIVKSNNLIFDDGRISIHTSDEDAVKHLTFMMDAIDHIICLRREGSKNTTI